MTGKTIENGTAADAYLAVMADRGVDYLFANAGTDFAPLIEALAKAEVNGGSFPRPVTVPHENVAVGMALGYYLVTGKPQLVMVHVNVGTANAICGIMNAWRGNVPILFSAGRTPYSEEGGLLGQRSGEIHWPQEMRDQGSMLREFVKWDYELPNSQVMESAIDRAINISMSEPKGPIYLTLPREMLAEPLDSFTYQTPSRRRTPSAPYPDPRAIDEAAEMIARAENPLIITSSAGRDGGDVAKLAALAECFAIPVTQRKPRYMCLPTDHDMHLGYDPDSFIEQADVIIVMECDVPWIPGRKAPLPDCKVIHMAVDPLFSAYPIRGFTSDLGVTGVLSGSLPMLTEALMSRHGAARDRIEARRRRLAESRAAQRSRWAALLDKGRTQDPLHPAWITHCINEVKSADTILIKESPLTWEHLDLSLPGTFFSAGAAGGLGWGLGTALGAKMADRDKLVVCTVGDGAYMFGNPVPAHYVAKAENLPILTIVFNNQMWGAVKRNTREVYPGGYAAKSNREPLTYFDTQLAFEKAVETAGGYGECVSNPAEMPRALGRALDAIKGGNQALLNVICSGP
ncbi:MAG: thiamine pyrophosphate enzyme-like TPP-binding protein [Hyphomicrobiales bacterium]|nr:thiamine pyrophosphate enzyme-like TPP-binding protein [Hyphomicrobiales bacterium]